jgi:hypothetical protein
MNQGKNLKPLASLSSLTSISQEGKRLSSLELGIEVRWF